MKTTILCLLLTFAFSACMANNRMDGEEVYKNNCNRCHITIRTYPVRMSRSIVRHMRIKALLTKPEADAVLAYLSEGFEPAQKQKMRRAAQ